MAVTVKTVSVHYERKQNLGDFSSATVGFTVWADVDDGEDLNEVMQGLWSMAKANVKANLVPEARPGSMKTEEQFLGLPIELQQAAAKALKE